jgi:hypothetical protein
MTLNEGENREMHRYKSIWKMEARKRWRTVSRSKGIRGGHCDVLQISVQKLQMERKVVQYK